MKYGVIRPQWVKTITMVLSVTAVICISYCNQFQWQKDFIHICRMHDLDICVMTVKCVFLSTGSWSYLARKRERNHIFQCSRVTSKSARGSVSCKMQTVKPLHQCMPCKLVTVMNCKKGLKCITWRDQYGTRWKFDASFLSYSWFSRRHCIFKTASVKCKFHSSDATKCPYLFNQHHTILNTPGLFANVMHC